MKRGTPSMNFHENACETLKIYQINKNKSIVYIIFIKNLKIRICLVCNRAKEIVWVHGHGQCIFCKSNIDPCCGEETNQHEDKDNTKYLKRGDDVFEKIAKHGPLFLLPFLTQKRATENSVTL